MGDQDELRERRDADGIALPEALAAHGVDLDRALEARAQLAGAAAYLELHIEQGPVLESLDLPLGVVLGTFGVERHRITFRGQAAHAGSTPMDQRRDALAGRREARARDPRDREADRRRRGLHDGRRRHAGRGSSPRSSRRPSCLLDQRHLDAAKLARDAEQRARRRRSGSRAEEDVEVEWERIW